MCNLKPRKLDIQKAKGMQISVYAGCDRACFVFNPGQGGKESYTEIIVNLSLWSIITAAILAMVCYICARMLPT